MSSKIDVLKALGIIFMVFMHTGHDTVHEVFTYLPVWRLPMFIFISGYLFKSDYASNVFFYMHEKSFEV